MKRPLLHKRVSRDTSDGSNERLSESLSIRTSKSSPYFRSISSGESLSPLFSSKTPRRFSFNNPFNQPFFFIASALCFTILLIWIYCQYQLIPSISHSNDKSNTKNSYPYQYQSVSFSNYKLFSEILHSQCRYSYSHNLTDIGDIYLQYTDNNVPFLQILTFSDYGIIKHKTSKKDNVKSLLQLINTMNSHLRDNAHFIISSGDHFYDNNVNDVHHYRWSAIFDKFIENKIFLSAVGNKDWVNQMNDISIENIKAQLDKTYWSSNWCLPRLYYTVRFIFQNQISRSFSVRFIALDTTSYLRKLDHFQYLKDQYEWLQQLLEMNKNDDWIIVFGHHPFESIKDKNKSNQQKKRRYTFQRLNDKNVWNKKMKNIVKLLLRYDNVKTYISGHHHIWRVCNIHDENDKMKLMTMVTGSTGRKDQYFNNDLPLHMIAGGDEVSFGKVTIYRNMLRLQIIDKDNNTLFSQIYTKQMKL